MTIKIIHNLDRDETEMIQAITGWFPLYISGMIQPYTLRGRNTRFFHTLFLHLGNVCIHGFFPIGSGENRWYDYVTDKTRLDDLEAQSAAMLSGASLFLKTYPATQREEFFRFREEKPYLGDYLLSGLPVWTIPEELFACMIARAELDDKEKTALSDLYRKRRERFFDALRHSSVNVILCTEQTADRGKTDIRINLETGLFSTPLTYREAEYAAHKSAVASLVRNEKNFHLTLLPFTPFRDLQIIATPDAVAVIRCQEPVAAFVFFHPMLTRSVNDYLASLAKEYMTNRAETIRRLEKLT